MTKKSAGEAFQILDIHECGAPFKEEDVLKVYSTIHEIILKLPDYASPEEGKSLHEYLSTSKYLQPNIQYWSFDFEGITLNPQIDMIRYNNKSVHVIDWKVSDSNTSDYSRQLYIAGIVAFHNIKKDYQAKGWIPPKIEDFKLYEFNLMNGNLKEHSFTKESTAATLDYIFMHGEEQEQLSGNKNWNELNIHDYETTDKKETCEFCKYRPLCIHLIKNNYTYDENEYYKLVSDRQLAGY